MSNEKDQRPFLDNEGVLPDMPLHQIAGNPPTPDDVVILDGPYKGDEGPLKPVAKEPTEDTLTVLEGMHTLEKAAFMLYLRVWRKVLNDPTIRSKRGIIGPIFRMIFSGEDFNLDPTGRTVRSYTVHFGIGAGLEGADGHWREYVYTLCGWTLHDDIFVNASATLLTFIQQALSLREKAK